LSIFGVVIWLRSWSRELAWRRHVSLGLGVVVIRIGRGIRVRFADGSVQPSVRITIAVFDRRPVLRLERAIGLFLWIPRALMGRVVFFGPTSGRHGHVRSFL
jgi:hypothetical protein